MRYIQNIADGKVRYAATAQRSADVAAGSRKFENATINGTQAPLLDIRHIEVDQGRFMTEDEDTAGSPVVILGRAVSDGLFPTVDPWAGRFASRAGRLR